MIGAVAAPTALLVRPDGHVAWVERANDVGLGDALTAWFGPPAARPKCPCGCYAPSKKRIRPRSYGPIADLLVTAPQEVTLVSL